MRIIGRRHQAVVARSCRSTRRTWETPGRNTMAADAGPAPTDESDQHQPQDDRVRPAQRLRLEHGPQQQDRPGSPRAIASRTSAWPCSLSGRFDKRWRRRARQRLRHSMPVAADGRIACADLVEPRARLPHQRRPRSAGRTGRPRWSRRYAERLVHRPGFACTGAARSARRTRPATATMRASSGIASPTRPSG